MVQQFDFLETIFQYAMKQVIKKCRYSVTESLGADDTKLPKVIFVFHFPPTSDNPK